MAPAVLGTGRIHGRYDVVETVGRGGQGTVAKALDIRHDRFVALKIRRVPSDPLDLERLLAEARTLLTLSPHPGLPVARDDFFEDDRHVLVLDWVDGIDLGRVLASDGSPGLPPSTVLRWAAQAAAALTHLHHHDPPIVHGDVKPANLVLDRRGRIVCVDFGVSSTPGRVQRGGTPGYRAPELAAGRPPTPAADVYGLAATVFALLTGAPPTGTLPQWHGMDRARAEHLEAGLRRGLTTDPDRRPATAGELVELLRGGEPDTVPTGTVTVLATDIVDSMARWEEHPQSMPGALARHDLIIDRVVERHEGRRVAGTADGGSTLSVFARAAHAVRAAVAVNQELMGVTAPPIQVRAGLHTGADGDDDGHGPAALRASRVCALAGPGQVMLSAATARLIAAEHLDGIVLVALGAHRLTGSEIDEDIVAVAAAGLDVPPDPTVAPYPGLAPFTPEDADVFMSRDAAVTALRALVTAGRVVAVLGPSGSGKSSVLRAGLAPHLPGATIVTPGADPLAVLDGAGDGVLIVDQLEELFTLGADTDTQRAFVEGLCAHPAGVVVALRADALAALARFPALADAVTSHHVLLAPLRPDQLRVAIEAPAACRGLTLEPGLTELVLADAGDEPGGLPLVAHAMRETWLRREGRRLTVAGYQQAGGVRGAIAATAEAVFATLSATDRERLRALLLRMVQPGDGAVDSRRRVEVDELRGLTDWPTTERLVDQLARSRLVTVDGSSVQPAHEALLRAWPRLAAWIDERRDDLHRRRHLTAAADTWATSGHDPAELYRGGRLHGAVDLSDRLPLTGAEQGFIDASLTAESAEIERSAATNRRLRLLLGGVGIALVVAVLAGIAAVTQLGRASDQRDRADVAAVHATTERLGAEARAAAPTRPDLALLLAVEGIRRDDTFETRSSLLGSLTARPQLLGVLHGVVSGLESIAWSPDESMMATPTSDSTGTLLWDGTTFERLGPPLATGAPFEIDFDAGFTPDGRTLAVVGVTEERSATGVESASATLQAWDLPTRSLRSTVTLGVLPEEVSALDNTHMVVLGAPSSGRDEPEPVAATQVVDLGAGEAGPVLRVPVEPLAATLAGSTLVVLGSDGTVTIKDTVVPAASSTAAPPVVVDVGDLVDPTIPPTVLGYDPATGVLAIGSDAGTVVLARIDGRTATTPRAAEIRRIDLGSDPPSVIRFSADGGLLAIGGLLGSAHIFDSTTGQPVGPPLVALSSQFNDLAFNADSTRLAVAGLDGTGSVWSLDGTRTIGRPIAGHDDAVVATLPRPDGETVLTASFDGSVVARNTDDGAIRWRVDTGEPVWTAVLDPTGTRLAVGGAEGQLEVIDATDGTATSDPVRFDQPVEGLAWSPTASLLAIGADRSGGEPDHRITFVDPDRLRPAGDAVTVTGGSAMGLAFSPDGSRLAAVLDNNLVRVIDVADRSLEEDYLESVDVPYFSVAWSPDGRRIATGTTGGTVQLWDAGTLEPSAPAGRQSPYPVRGLAFSADSRLLVSTTELATSQLWAVATGAPLGGDLVGGDAPITVSAVPEPDRPEIPFVPGFSPDGRVLYVGSDEPMTWSIDPADWRAAACAVAGRDLTADEWAQYLPNEPTRVTCPG